MKNTIVNLALRYALKDIAALLRFVATLEDRLEAYLVKQEAQIEAVAAKMDKLAAEKAALTRDVNLTVNIKAGVANLRG